MESGRKLQIYGCSRVNNNSNKQWHNWVEDTIVWNYWRLQFNWLLYIKYFNRKILIVSHIGIKKRKSSSANKWIPKFSEKSAWIKQKNHIFLLLLFISSSALQSRDSCNLDPFTGSGLSIAHNGKLNYRNKRNHVTGSWTFPKGDVSTCLLFGPNIWSYFTFIL